jgi:Phage portal protein
MAMAETMRGAGQPAWPLDPYQVQVTYSASQGISRGTGADWFGPLNPLAPIAPPDVAGRRFDFPPGYNLVQRPRAYEPIGFAELRAFADACDLLRLVIETRKDQVEQLRWTVKPRDPVLRRSSKRPAEMQGRIDAATSFLRRPDGYAGWKAWIGGLLEDMFVIDAATLYCQRTRSGKLVALHQLDGATIKRVIDDWGRTPRPYRGADGAMVYPPAYQQVLKGFPAVNYSTRDIIYRPRNIRPHKVYGYSPVQQVLLTVQIALRRQIWMLDYYTEGSIPDALIGVPATWTVNQLKQFQDYWDTEFAGDLGKRRRAKFVPGEVAGKIHQTKEPEQKNAFDEWLARVICYAFSVSPQWAVSMMNRATAQQHSTDAQEEGLEPTKEWVKDVVDDVIADELDSPDLELAWVEEDDTDPSKQNGILDNRVRSGRMTINEARDADGLERYTDPAADKPMVYTAALGYLPIEANIGVAPGGGTPGPLSGAPDENATEEHETATEEIVG